MLCVWSRPHGRWWHACRDQNDGFIVFNRLRFNSRLLRQVVMLDPCRARALYESGLKTPNDILRATDEVVKKALSKAMPSEMKRHDGAHVQKGTHAAVQVGMGAHIGANTLLNRSMQSVISMVHKHIKKKATDQYLVLHEPQAASEVPQSTQLPHPDTFPSSGPPHSSTQVHTQAPTQVLTSSHSLPQDTCSDGQRQAAPVRTRNHIAQSAQPPPASHSTLTLAGMVALQPPPCRLHASQPAAPGTGSASQPAPVVVVHPHAQHGPLGAAAQLQSQRGAVQSSAPSSTVQTDALLPQRAGPAANVSSENVPMEAAVPPAKVQSQHNSMQAAMPAARTHLQQASGAVQPDFPSRAQAQPVPAQYPPQSNSTAAYLPRCSGQSAQSRSQHHRQQQQEHRHATHGDAAQLQYAPHQIAACCTSVPLQQQRLQHQRQNFDAANQWKGAVLKKNGPQGQQCFEKPAVMHKTASCHAIVHSNTHSMHAVLPAQPLGSLGSCVHLPGASENSTLPARSVGSQCSYSAPTGSQVHPQSSHGHVPNGQQSMLPRKHARSDMSYEQDLWTSTKSTRVMPVPLHGNAHCEAT